MCFLQRLFVLIISMYSSLALASHFYIGGDLGINYFLTKSTESAFWSGARVITTNQYANYAMNGDLAIGYVKTFDKFFAGFNGAINVLNNKAASGTSGSFGGASYNDTDEVKLNYFYELLLQTGYFLRESTQLYVTAGAANGRIHFIQSYKYTTQSAISTADNTKSIWGFDAGIGIKENITDKLALNFSVQNISFQTQTMQEIHANSLDKKQYFPSLLFAKIGLEYRFG